MKINISTGTQMNKKFELADVFIRDSGGNTKALVFEGLPGPYVVLEIESAKVFANELIHVLGGKAKAFKPTVQTYKLTYIRSAGGLNTIEVARVTFNEYGKWSAKSVDGKWDVQNCAPETLISLEVIK